MDPAVIEHLNFYRSGNDWEPVEESIQVGDFTGKKSTFPNTSLDHSISPSPMSLIYILLSITYVDKIKETITLKLNQ